MKKLQYTKENNYWEAQDEFGDYYCTGKDGSGLADSTAKRKLHDAVAADKNW